MQELRVGVIGIGNIGSTHAKNIYIGQIKGMNLSAVCDIDPEKLKMAKEKMPNVAVFENYRDLLTSGVDTVIIATPHYLHPVIAIDAFSKGLNVLTEKPIGVFPDNVVKMIEAAKKSGKVFGIMYNQRTSPVFAAARDFIRAGRLGAPKRLTWIITNWYRTQSYYNSGCWRATWAGEGGGVLMNQAVHNLDLWQWIFGMPKTVTGFCSVGKYHNIEVEDDVTVCAEYENGATAVFITSTGECPGTNRLEITGDRAKLVLEGGKLKIWELNTPEREVCFTAKEGFYKPVLTYSEPELESAPSGHNIILQNFADAILHKTALLAPGEEGLNALKLINGIYLSSWQGNRPVELPVDGELYASELQKRIKTSSLRNVKNVVHSDAESNTERWSVNW